MAYTGKGTLVNRAALADFFGVSLVTIDNWVRGGCPVVTRGSRGVEWQFNTADVRKWREDEIRKESTGDAKQDENKLRQRRASAETARAELELAKELQLVAPVEQMERAVAKVMAEICQRMRNIPGRAVTRLIGETDERRFKAVLREEIDAALEAAAEVDVTADPDAIDEEGGD